MIRVRLCIEFPWCLRASLLLQWWVSLCTNFLFKGTSPQTICARLDRPVNALQLCCWTFSHKETLSQTLFETSSLSYGKWPLCVFEPPLGGLALSGNIRCSSILRLLGKLLLEFLLVIIEVFCLREWAMHYAHDVEHTQPYTKSNKSYKCYQQK